MKYSIEYYRDLALERKGLCLSDEYQGPHKPLLWQCEFGHQWRGMPNNVKRGAWCPECGYKRSADLKKPTISDMQELARSRKGFCLSAEYIDAVTKLDWECKEGHRWSAIPDSIKRGSWCPECASKNSGKEKRLTIGEMRAIAEQRGGFCLSKTYKSIKISLKWKCSEGHVWMASPGNVKAGKWCRVCAGLEKLTLKDMQNIAESRGGKCLSLEYENVDSNLEWECSEGHRWQATANSVKSGTWCGVCKANIGENICRTVLESLFNKKFPKFRPPWLINGRGNKMEIDGYCDDLRLGFEHQGIQHYKFIDYFHKTEDALLQRKQDDEEKRKLCKENGVFLIQIPSVPDLTSIEDLQSYILKELESLKFPRIPKVQKKIDIDYLNVYSSSAKSKFAEILAFVKKKKGKVLSKTYFSNRQKMKFECSKKHIWSAIWSNVQRNRWCPICAKTERANKRRFSIENAVELAERNKGYCLSKKYLNNSEKLKWKCAEGHIWNTSYNNVQQGKWCPVCARKKLVEARKLGWNEIETLAKRKKGKCLSEEYQNTKTKMLWQCEFGHQWRMDLEHIKRGQWCPECRKQKR